MLIVYAVLLPKKVTYSVLIDSFKKGTFVDALMESKGGKKSSSSNFMYEAPLGYKIEDVRPAGGIKKFQSAAYSNVKINHHNGPLHSTSFIIRDGANSINFFLCCSAQRGHPDIPFGFLVLVV